MAKRVTALILAIVFSAITLSGCWDKVEIDQRAFIGVIMIDMAPSDYQEEMAEDVEGIPGIEKQEGEMIKVTYIFPDARILGEGGGGGDEKGFVTLSSIAPSIAKTNGYVDSRLSRSLYYGHTQVIIFGEEFLKHSDKLKEVMDFFNRSPRFNRTARVLVAEGEASKVAETIPKGEKLMFRYIRDILQNEVTNGRLVEVNFNQFVSSMRQDGNTVIPRIIPKKDEVKISGLGVMRDYKLQGFLSEYDTLYFNTLYGKRRGGREYINLNNISATFNTNNTVKKMRLLNSDINNLEVGINVVIEGSIADKGFENEIFDAEIINRLEKEYDKSSVESCNFVIKKLQQQLKADALKIGDYLYKYHPDIWQEIQGKWEEVYPKIKITPIINHKIRRTGEVK
ncbi:spore germination protein B3 precursor [Oxobacter pfennigii]|uniref:Spore germination protein B3 n=1 Tax=Oxobacter pfennigii TaxID=36849 RepID=A0A0P8WA35_9CLOT|nr:Ger(x)C family spore germination protein [Oxobacter pfennigii]KPU44580.1 spore germination protein B3 precursor [Oxobacter pfennigii]